MDPNSIVRLRIEICEIRPKIFRTVDVAASISLTELHEVIQCAFDWWDYHLWQFEIDGLRFGTPDPFEPDDELIRSDTVSLAQTYSSGVNQFTYLYDFGDHWLHSIQFEESQASRDNVVCPVLVEGQGRTPPEDVGGVSGYYDYLSVLNDVTHEDHAELLRWRGPFDPNRMNTRLRKLA